MSFADIQVIDVHPQTRVVSFVIKPKKLTGISKLIQLVVLSLLNVPGQDVLDPDRGGGLPSLLGSNISPNDSTEIFADVVQRVKKSQREIIDAQIGLNDDPEEKLQEIQIVSIDNGNIDEIFIRLRIVNELGRATDIVV